MTVTAQGLSPQTFTPHGIGSQTGSFSPAFPNPIGAEQSLGFPQAAQGFQPTIWPQPGAWQTPYYMPTPTYSPQPWASGQGGNNGPAPFGTQQFGTQQFGVGTSQPQQQVIGQIVGQVLPLVQQMILPQVISMALPLVQQLITQVAAAQFIGQPSAAVPFGPGIRQYAGQY